MTASNKPVVVVVGSLHYDIMVDAPDRPRKGETVTGYAWRPKFGGKGGNQAVAAAKAGAEVRMAGAVGADEFGRFLLDALGASGVDASRVARLPEAGSGMSVAISDAGGDYGAVIVSGANLLVDPAALADPGLWQGARALILQNEMPDAINVAAARAARTAGATVCLNAAPYRPLSEELAALVDLLVVNAIEAEELGGLAVTDLASAAAAAEALAGSLSCRRRHGRRRRRCRDAAGRGSRGPSSASGHARQHPWRGRCLRWRPCDRTRRRSVVCRVPPVGQRRRRNPCLDPGRHLPESIVNLMLIRQSMPPNVV